MHDYVVTPIEPDMPADEQTRASAPPTTSVIKLNHVVHHGALGHHVQNFYADRGDVARSAGSPRSTAPAASAMFLRRHDGRGVGVLRDAI